MSLNYLVTKPWNIFSYVSQIELIQYIRNFFCEKIAFYFLWLVSYIRGLFILTIFSCAVYGMVRYESVFTKEVIITLNSLYDEGISLSFNSMDLIYLIFCVLVGIWSTIFFNYWENSEEYYAYLWGTQNVESTEPYRKEFRHHSFKEFIFEKKIPMQKKWVKRLKQFISALVICLMGYITILIVNGLLKLNPDNQEFYNNSTNLNSSNAHSNATTNITNIIFNSTSQAFNRTANNTINTNSSAQSIDDILRNTDVKTFTQNPWPILIGIFNGIQIELMSWGYAKLAKLLNDWENHEKESDYENNYIFKIMVYDFINNFNSLFNIAFAKVTL